MIRRTVAPRVAGLKVLALFDTVRPVSLDQDLSKELQTPDWKTEAHVLEALRELKCEVVYQAVFDDINVIHQQVERFKPDVIFNLVDQFKNDRSLDHRVAAYLELLGVPFTGCSSAGLLLCKHKAISKKVLYYSHVPTPAFITMQRGRRPFPPKRLHWPLLVKPLKEEASFGISQASLVDDPDAFCERVKFIHEKFDQDAIAEEYIEGREIYVSIMGEQRLELYPIRELVFSNLPPDVPRFATYRVKWNEAYRQRYGIRSEPVHDLEPKEVEKILRLCRKIYEILELNGYVRMDLRYTPEGEVVFLEANPNPALARDEDFALSAKDAGVDYPELIARILYQGLNAVRE